MWKRPSENAAADVVYSNGKKWLVRALALRVSVYLSPEDSFSTVSQRLGSTTLWKVLCFKQSIFFQTDELLWSHILIGLFENWQ